MTQPKIVDIRMGLEGAQLVLNGLAKLPYEQVAELIAVIRFQVEQQLKSAPAAPVQAQAAQPAKRRGGRPKGSRNKAKPAVEQTTTTTPEGASLQ